MSKKIKPIEKLIVCSIIIMVGIMVMPNMQVVPPWSNGIKTEVSTRNVQMAVDSFVAKNYIQPVEGEKVNSLLVPKQIKLEDLDELKSIQSEKNLLYFLDYLGKVWSERPENLLTVTKQDNKIIFNNNGCNIYKIWEFTDEKSNPKIIETITSDNDIINYEIKDNTKQYLVQPIYKDHEGMPVGVGFDGRIFKN